MAHFDSHKIPQILRSWRSPVQVRSTTPFFCPKFGQKNNEAASLHFTRRQPLFTQKPQAFLIHLQVNKTTGFAGEYRKIFRNSL
jgi:hypothetical protein